MFCLLKGNGWVEKEAWICYNTFMLGNDGFYCLLIPNLVKIQEYFDQRECL